MTEAIGVFDSGVGGLTVLKALMQRWPHENFVYLADTARLPYGSKSLATIHQYAQQCANALLRHDQKLSIKALVVACNSASTAILNQPLQVHIPVFNVVEPGARSAVQISKSQRLGVLGTRATVASQAYVRAIQKLSPEAQVFQQACPLFVPLVEEGWVDDPITNLVAYRYAQPLIRQNIDTVVLGCTHYPVLTSALKKAFGQGVDFVDAATALAEDLGSISVGKDSLHRAGELRLLATDFSPRLHEMIEFLLGPSPQPRAIETIDI